MDFMYYCEPKKSEQRQGWCELNWITLGKASARFAYSAKREVLNLWSWVRAPRWMIHFALARSILSCRLRRNMHWMRGSAHPNLNKALADLQSAALTTQLCSHIPICTNKLLQDNNNRTQYAIVLHVCHVSCASTAVAVCVYRICE